MNDLPSFLTRTGPAAYTLTFSASFAETAMLCGAKTSWRYVTGIEAAAPRAGMNYGKALHLALAHLYKCSHNPDKAGIASVAAELMALHFHENPQPALGSKGRPEWRTLARALQAFAAYREHYPAEDFEVVGVEEPFEVTLGTFETYFEVPETVVSVMRTTETEGLPAVRKVTVTVVFRGIRDLRVRWHDRLWVLDHKTISEWSDLVVDDGRCSFQFQGYAWVERLAYRQAVEASAKPGPFDGQNLTPTGGVIGNYLIAREPYANADRKPTPRDLPRDQFERQAYPYSDAQLDEWHARAMGVAQDIWRYWSTQDWPQRSPACAHWGRCEYYRLCWETDPEYRLAAALGADYRPRTPSPFEDEANGKERA